MLYKNFSPILIIASFLYSSCEDTPKTSGSTDTEVAVDTTSHSRKSQMTNFDSTTYIIVNQVHAQPSSDFNKIYSIAGKMHYKLLRQVALTDSIDFRCWTWVHSEKYERLKELLVFKGIANHYVSFEEITSKRLKKYFHFQEASFPSETAAIEAGKQIQDFIFKDSTTIAYDKLPTDIFQYKNRIYLLSVGKFMSIPDMKIASRKFRKMLDPSVSEIMLWEMYGYGEGD